MYKAKKVLTSDCDNSVCKTNFSKIFLVEWSNDCCLVFFVKWQKVGCYWKIFKSVFFFFWMHFILVSCLGSVAKETNHVLKDFSQEFSKHHFNQSKVSRFSLPKETSNYCWPVDQRNRIFVNSFLPWIVTNWQYSNKKSCGFCCILF